MGEETSSIAVFRKGEELDKRKTRLNDLEKKYDREKGGIFLPGGAPHGGETQGREWGLLGLPGTGVSAKEGRGGGDTTIRRGKS